VIAYRRDKARNLSAALSRMPQFVFEAHSTDYQSVETLRAMVEDGFAILKVGPWLTFALRETLYGLDHIAHTLDPDFNGEGLRAAMERLMVHEPMNWEKYYHGDATWRRIQRHFSYSDRIRYYWPHPEAMQAVSRLLSFFEGRSIPETLVSQYLASAYPGVAQGHLKSEARELLFASVHRVLDIYSRACGSVTHMH
jgi:D-tagatose-1,6-bisphosphate aldolase subunit GatZ/KbaZ